MNKQFIYLLTKLVVQPTAVLSYILLMLHFVATDVYGKLFITDIPRKDKMLLNFSKQDAKEITKTLLCLVLDNFFICFKLCSCSLIYEVHLYALQTNVSAVS